MRKLTETQRAQADCLADMFEEHGITATRGQIEQISLDFAYGLEMEREMSFTSHMHSKPESCKRCTSKDEEIKNLESDISAYKNGVKRRHSQARYVYVKDGNVYYGL